MLDIVVIDNYDSFTWNIVEYLSALTERQIDVYRNDKITIETLKSLSPKLLVISPGPGHPETDAGISSDAISEFAGKIPILGVCMGQQCIFTVFGGKVEETGEILHGKTSLVRHDGKGLYVGVPQDIPVTRYHSLAGTKSTLPDCLELTCWTESGVIMGIRHKEYAIEGVQYHPESILSEGGKMMLGNFLKLKGGTWIENDEAAKPSACTIPPKTNGKKSKTILETIHEQRLKDIAVSKTIPGSTGRDLETFLSLNLAPPLIDFPTRLRQNRPAPGVMAEIKRASPSKGDIDIQANAAQQATLYARGGASVISVLTEPKWFKGSLADLRAARDAVDTMPNRPALLRKDFIVDPYQIMEARAYGADTVLLIVAMLSEAQLTELYNYSKSLSMEPLVEVNNAEEMKIALKLGAKVIGVNNRNLHDFVVDLDTTSRLAEGLSSEVTLCALSGITGRKDVEKYTSEGVGAVLVGEALMRASDKGKFIDGLLGVNSANGAKGILPLPLVKICGTRTSEGALAAAEAGADFIGLIFARGRKRTITTEQARKIVSDVRTRFPASSSNETVPEQVPKTWFGYHAKAFATHPKKPLFVGVFQDQSLQEILEIQASVPLDIVQLHGSEPLEWARLIPCRVFKAFDLTEPALAKPGYHALPILDATSTDGTKGGTGTRLDTEAVRRYISTTRVPAILAGGLNPDNVAEFIFSTPCIGVDVSSGVERDGKQDIQLIKRFVANAKNARRSETVQDLDY